MPTPIRWLIWSVVVGVIILTITTGGLWAWRTQVLDAPGPHSEDVIFIVEAGNGHATLRYRLKSAGVIHQTYHYDAARIMAGDQFVPKAGEYLLPAASSLNEVMDILHSGRSYQRRITVVEGLRSSEVVAQIMAMGHLSGTIDKIPDEGSLLPETYFFTHNTKRAALIARMQDVMAITIAEAWASRADDLPYKRVQDAVIMASIIEKESSIASERRMVASVLVNRLKKGMRLQSDPTVVYDTNPEIEMSRVITKADLKQKTPWNTYVIKGLPKTPIANPSRESILAALNPADSDYLYFVSDGKGGLRFAKTLDAHNRNVRLFRQIQRAAKK
ncbi:endolytic transglycosylase MltG [Candidatus Puniceispirillum sp.]|uniref:endolytic transglycosylase MltG n=1 Tax=Candidatus Puniceispirillum sp. TaxID=2026719 RepID=UPI003F6A2660